jgi:hypothetical protein
MTIEIMTPVGRLVAGHPMEFHGKTDSKTDQPILDKVTGLQATSMFSALAVPKGPEEHWNQTEWGAKVWQAGIECWTNNEHLAPAFAWKVRDGDSVIPNKYGDKPCDKEGYPGHWIIGVNTSWAVPTYYPGRYNPIQAIQDPKEIKRGDYMRILINAVGNKPSQSPGVYLNPVMFELTRAGIAIISTATVDANEKFGAVAGVLPQGALIDAGVVPPAAGVVPPAAGVVPPAAGVVPPAPVEPAYDIVTPPPAPVIPPAPPAHQMTALAQQSGYTYEALQAAGYSDDVMRSSGFLV